jgi:hypothetical protein
MEFETTERVQGELGARIEDVVQEAVDAVTAAYLNDAAIDVEDDLRTQLTARGVRPVDDRWIPEASRRIRAGHEVTVGRHDGSVDPGRAPD